MLKLVLVAWLAAGAAGKEIVWIEAEQFEVAVGGRTIDRVFGGSGRRGWVWEDGGVHELSGDEFGKDQCWFSDVVCLFGARGRLGPTVAWPTRSSSDG